MGRQLVGFSHSELMEKRQSIRLDDCEVKQDRRGEIMLKGTTTINVSPKIFGIPIEEMSDIESQR